ncbi:MAG: hypothetical protein KDD33_01105 [Bdellovibrionales bacterium]|nr:hypothetical protein [Bdellovibrionales bacterium]
MMKSYMIMFSIFLAMGAFAAPKEKPAANKPKARTGKEVSFDEILVQGKHHFSDEAVVTVEQDKVLDALLEVRKDFKDRIKKSAKRN